MSNEASSFSNHLIGSNSMLPIKKGALAFALSCASLNAVQPSLVAKGPLFGKFCYWVVKSLGYGVPTTIATSTIGGAAAAVLPAPVGESINLGMAALTTTETAGLMTGTQFATTVATGFEGLPVVGFVRDVAATTLPAGTTLVTMTAEQAAQHAAAVTASMFAPGLAANGAVAAVASSALPAASVPAAAGGVVAGKAIIATIGIEAAGAAVAAVTTAANGVAAYTTMVEGAALTAGALGTAFPWLP